jgi:uncharacterized Ntn-hydrolase superfamily protein
MVRPVTYSIVARDPATGDLGVAVQSRAFATGAAVPWVEPGVGAVASQAFGDASYGVLGLRLLRAGKTPEQALAGLTAADPDSAVRQVAMMDASGHAAAHTGAACIRDAGQVVGDGFSAQANMCRGSVWEAMADAYLASTGSLARRLLAALDAGEEAGGDFRGRQAAGILVRPASGQPWDRVSNLRVDDHAEPLAELRRLLTLEEAYRRRNRLEDVIREGDSSAAAAEVEAARAAGLPELDVVLTESIARLLAGDVSRARDLVGTLLDAEPRWRGYVEFIAERHVPRARELLDS